MPAQQSVQAQQNVQPQPNVQTQAQTAAASARRVLDRLAVPALLVTAMDDPFVPPDAAADPALASLPRLTRVITRHGGHCGYVGRANEPGDDGYWAERAAVDFVVGHAAR